MLQSIHFKQPKIIGKKDIWRSSPNAIIHNIGNLTKGKTFFFIEEGQHKLSLKLIKIK